MPPPPIKISLHRLHMTNNLLTRTQLRAYLRTYLVAYLPTFLLAHILAHVQVYLPTSVLA